MQDYLGHSRNDDGNGVSETLKMHLSTVAKRTSDYMRAWDHEVSGSVAGYFHDLGKYADQMQQRLVNPAKFSGKNHAAAGACWIAHQYINSWPLALAVLYHHGGLKVCFSGRKQLIIELLKNFQDKPSDYTETNINMLIERFMGDFPDMPTKKIPRLFTRKMAADMLDVRMMASALDDADFIETEAHFLGDSNVVRQYRQEGASLDVDRALLAVLTCIATKKTENQVVQNVRSTLCSCCEEAGDYPIGSYFLSAPTGSGKTLSMLLFALRHAKTHGLRRIVLVMPFLNIIDQTAMLYRKIFSFKNGFPQNYVLEDHSLAGFEPNDAENDLEDKRQRTRKLLSENWDAPIVLTTSVKFFESLHASRNSKLRKLHRLAKSVVLFDEAQSLPPDLAAISLATLSRLVGNDNPYGSSVVFATATQPAFDSISPIVEKYSSCGWKPDSLISEETTQFLFDSMANRVHVSWREQDIVTLEDLSVELAEGSHNQCLCIVNLKRHARHLVELLIKKMDENVVFHLSTSMCAKHRKTVLDKVVNRLKKNKQVVLIATQCVEAGVDISFPVVYRALAPLESIAQAAGRCNRHGGEIGSVIVFTPSDEKGFFPSGYKEGISVTQMLLAECRSRGENPDDLNLLNSPEFIRRYYKLFFDLGNYKEERKSQAELHRAVDAGYFEEVSRIYRLIPGDTVNVLVPHDEAEFNRLRAVVQKREFMNAQEIRKWVHEAREYAVGVYRPKPDSLKWMALEPVQFGVHFRNDNHDADWFISLPEAEYDSVCGLKLPESFEGIC